MEGKITQNCTKFIGKESIDSMDKLGYNLKSINSTYLSESEGIVNSALDILHGLVWTYVGFFTIGNGIVTKLGLNGLGGDQFTDYVPVGIMMVGVAEGIYGLRKILSGRKKFHNTGKKLSSLELL